MKNIYIVLSFVFGLSGLFYISYMNHDVDGFIFTLSLLLVIGGVLGTIFKLTEEK